MGADEKNTLCHDDVPFLQYGSLNEQREAHVQAISADSECEFVVAALSAQKGHISLPLIHLSGMGREDSSGCGQA